MSEYYTIKEHLAVNCVSEYTRIEISDAVNCLKFELAKLSALLILDLAYIDKMNLTADGKNYSFSGRHITCDYQSLVEAIGEADQFDFEVEYGFWEYADMGIKIDPWNTADCFGKTIDENPQLANSFYYSFYNKADGEGGVGSLYACGTLDGKRYGGDISPAIVSAPKDGVWMSVEAVVAVCATSIENIDANAFNKCVEDFKTLGAEISCIDNPYDIYVNSITLNSSRDILEFIRICGELDRATDGQCSFMAEFVDFSGKDARILVIDLDDISVPVIKIAEI